MGGGGEEGGMALSLRYCTLFVLSSGKWIGLFFPTKSLLHLASKNRFRDSLVFTFKTSRVLICYWGTPTPVLVLIVPLRPIMGLFWALQVLNLTAFFPSLVLNFGFI